MDLVCRLLLEKNFFNDTATTEIYTLSLHDALPISLGWVGSAVTELTLGYLPSENAGTGMRFVPVWRIETDAGSFYVNGITREITPL